MAPAPAFLRMRVVRSATVVPRPDMDDWSGGAGVLRRADGEPRVVAQTGIRRFGREQIPAPDTALPSPRPSVEAGVFAGYLYDHYGHFLTESLARLWPASLDPAVPVVWIAGWARELSTWMTDLLDILGVGPDRIVVSDTTGPLDVEELLVPDAGFEFGRHMHPWLARRLASVPAVDGTEHLWLSRSARVPISGLDEEIELETRLAGLGWTIVHPEQLTVREQLDRLARAVHVAGLEGSAFHTLALLRGFRGSVDLFTRQHHENFEIVADAAGLDQERHTLPGATPRERQKVRGTDVQWSGVDIDGVVEILTDRCRRHGHAPPA